MSKMFNKIKKFYDLGLWTSEMVHKAVDKGLITEEEYNLIVMPETEQADNSEVTSDSVGAE